LKAKRRKRNWQKKEVYEVMYIGTPETADDDIRRLNEAIKKRYRNRRRHGRQNRRYGTPQIAYPNQKKPKVITLF
jgi:ribosomal protein S6